jgi:predicted Zn-dependent peptidase
MRTRIAIQLAISLLLSATCLVTAQQRGEPEQPSTPRNQVELKNKAPVSKEILKVKLPRATEATLSNGLTVLVIEDHRLPLISIQYNIGASGPIFDPPNMVGLSRITAQMMTEGTKTRSSLQISQEVERLGAALSVSSTYGSSVTTLNASGLSDNFDKWLELADDVLMNPSFPANELDRHKQQLTVALRQQRTSAEFLMSERFSRAMYGDHPAANVTTNQGTVDALTPAILAKWHDDKYAPQNTVLGISGDVKANEVVPKLEKLLAGWKKTELKEALPANPKPATARKIYLVDRPDSVQTSLIMGNIAIDRRDPDHFVMVALNQILGGGGAGRLFKNLREEKGYTYGAYSSFSATKFPGPWDAYAEVRTEVTDGALTEFIKELQRLRDQPVSDQELDDAKRAIVASFALSLESPDELMNNAWIRKIYSLPEDYWDTYPAKLMAVTASDIQRVARKYIDPQTMQIIAVGDGSKIRTILEKYGPLERYDTQGKKLVN